MSIPFTQTKEYLSWHEAVGEKTFYKEFGSFVCASLIIELRVGKVLYVPYGPTQITKEIIDYLRELAKKENCVFVRLENELEKEKIHSALRGDKQNIYPYDRNVFSLFFANTFLPFKKTFAKEGIFQPRVEWWLSLNETEENIYNNFHKDHRYSVRRAEKEGIEVEIVEENLENYFSHFWSLLKETSERDGFSLYAEEYYKAIFKNVDGGMKKFLVFTKSEEKYLSVALVVINDKVANLVFAGSVSEKRELGFNHLMQWEAIKQAKKYACEIYNFGGVYENGYGKPGLKGVTNFKKRFGGYSQFHGDFIDLPIKKLHYFLYILRKMIY
jgi:lipid II:glycine glycyltransferase (peptidoglycan interpeptide bridge formation enzyme)